MTIARRSLLLLAPLLLRGAGPSAAVDGVLTSGTDLTGDAVVYLVPADRRPAPAEDSAVIDQVNLRFEPRVTVVTPGTRVLFTNSDPTGHNVFSPPGIGGGFDLGTWPMDEVRSYLFTEPGAYVLFCHVHPEMVAYVVVVPTGFHAVTDEAGHFTIRDVPAGRYVLRVWHRHLKDPVRTVDVPESGTLHVTIPVERTRHARGRTLDEDLR